MARKKSRIEIYEEQEVLLSKERTILSFMRTGLAFIGTGIIIASFFNDMPAKAVGYILVGIGFIEVFESVRRLVIKQREIEKLKKQI